MRQRKDGDEVSNRDYFPQIHCYPKTCWLKPECTHPTDMTSVSYTSSLSTTNIRTAVSSTSDYTLLAISPKATGLNLDWLCIYICIAGFWLSGNYRTLTGKICRSPVFFNPAGQNVQWKYSLQVMINYHSACSERREYSESAIQYWSFWQINYKWGRVGCSYSSSATCAQLDAMAVMTALCG